MNLLGIDIEPLTRTDARMRLLSMIQDTSRQHMVATPNPEILLKTEEDALRRILKSADILLPDGAGLQWATAFLAGIARKKPSSGFSYVARFVSSVFRFVFSPSYRSSYLPEKITGIDTVHTLADLSVQEKCSVFFLGSFVADEAAEAMKKQIIGLDVSGSSEAPPESANEVVTLVNESGASVLFVAYGAPVQESWIASHLKRMPGVRVAIGVGGAFDMIAGMKRRAPAGMQSAGLEWLWRLGLEPSRIGRIWNATVVFTWRVFRQGYAETRQS